jgi:hypothetical protein
MATLQELLGGGLPAGLLDPAQMQAAEQRAKSALLTNLGFALLQSSRGQPGQGKPSLGQVIGQAGPVGLQAYQQTFDKTLADALKGLQVKDVIAKQAETKRIQDLASKLPVQGGGINQEVANQLMTTPAGMDYLSKFTQTRRDIAGKNEVIEIFGTSGRPIKVRYNMDTNQYTPIGSEKAEPFVQIDLGNMVELRTPTGQIVGRLAKGAAPTGQSFSFNEGTGLVVNQKTGAVSQPRDEQGNLVDVSQFRKPSESQEKQVIGVQNTKNAIGEFRNELSNFTRLDTLKPNERARIETKYRNMLMQAKEAYNLGVLNGPDLAILEQIIYNPTSMKGVVVGRDAIDSQASELDRIMGNIKSTVQARGAAVPQTTSVISKQAPPGVRQELWDIMSPESKKLWQPQR